MKISLESALEKVCLSLNTVSRRPIYEKYDKNVQGNTVWERGQSLVSVSACFRDFPELDDKHSKIGVAVGTGGNPNYAKIDPGYAAEQAICEGALKVAAVGGEWLGATDCLNFGNPEKPTQMGQFVAGVEGIKTACEALEIPIVSGNVSLYNESSGTSIPPSALVSVFARVDQVSQVPGLALPETGDLFFIGEPSESLGGSEFLRVCGQSDADLPALNYERLQAQADIMRQLVSAELISMVNLVATGGLWKAVCESAFLSDREVCLDFNHDLSVPASLFGESLGLLVATNEPDKLQATAGELAIPVGKVTTGESVIRHNDNTVWTGSLSVWKKDWEDQLRAVV